MRVAALLKTHHLQEEVMPWMAEARSIFDELVTFIDEKRATVGTLNYARKLGDSRNNLIHPFLDSASPREARLTEPVKLDPSRKILPMVKLSPEKIRRVSFEIKSVPETVGVSELFWLDVEVTNATSETLHSRPPLLPVHLSYHRIEKVERRMCVWDGWRSAFCPDASANTTTRGTMMIVALTSPANTFYKPLSYKRAFAGSKIYDPTLCKNSPSQ